MKVEHHKPPPLDLWSPGDQSAPPGSLFSSHRWCHFGVSLVFPQVRGAVITYLLCTWLYSSFSWRAPGPGWARPTPPHLACPGTWLGLLLGFLFFLAPPHGEGQEYCSLHLGTGWQWRCRLVRKVGAQPLDSPLEVGCFFPLWRVVRLSREWVVLYLLEYPSPESGDARLCYVLLYQSVSPHSRFVKDCIHSSCPFLLVLVLFFIFSRKRVWSRA